MAAGHTVPAVTDACTCLYNCNNTHTPHVAATSFFAREVEIFDFVTERVKKCIAAKRDKVFGEIFYRHNVVGGVVNCTNDIYGVRTSLFLSSQRMNCPLSSRHNN